MVDTVLGVDRKYIELLLEETPGYRNPREELEQYITPSDIASKLLWEALLRGDVIDKTIADYGCGTLRLGLTALLLGCRRVVGVDIDFEPLDTVYEWLSSRDYRYRVLLINSDVRSIVLRNIDTVVMNPPFGVKKHNRGIDMAFLYRALETARRSVYTMHKASSGEEKLVRDIASSLGYTIVYYSRELFKIGMLYPRHRRRVYRVAIDMYGLRRVMG